MTPNIDGIEKKFSCNGELFIPRKAFSHYVTKFLCHMWHKRSFGVNQELLLIAGHFIWVKRTAREDEFYPC